MRQKQSPLLAYTPRPIRPPPLTSPLDLLQLPDPTVAPKLFEAWEAVIGRRLAQISKPLDFSEGRLRIGVQDPAWMREIDHIKGRYLHRINQRLGCHLLREIQLVLVPLSSEGPRSLPLDLLDERPPPTRPDRASPPSLSLESPTSEAPDEGLPPSVPPDLAAKIEEQLADLPEDYFKNCARRLLLLHHTKDLLPRPA